MRNFRDIPWWMPAFTRTDIIVGCGLLLGFFVLVVPALQVCRVGAKPTICATRIMSIAAAQMTYAVNWSGWTNSDPGYFVKQFGCKLNSEVGYFGENPPWYDPSAQSPSRSQQ